MFYIAHSAEGSVWKKHKYLKRIDGKYYYPDSYEGGRHLSDLKKKSKEVMRGKELKEKPIDGDIEKIAKEIISGKYGNGNENRRKALGMTAEEYEVVRKKVNEMMRGTGSKSIVVSKSTSSTQMPAPEKQKTSKKNTKKSGGLNMDKVYRVYK